MPVRQIEPEPHPAAAVQHPKLVLSSSVTRDRVRRAIQDGKTSDGEVLAVARLEDLSDQVMQQATPSATKFQVRFTAVPTQNFVSCFVVPLTLVAFVDGNPAPVTPSVDVDSNGVFTLPSPPAETLQVTYCWEYFQDASLDGFVDEARAWIAGPATYASLGEVPDGLTPALIDYAAARALRALASKCALANARAGDSEMSFGELMKAYAANAKEKEATASAARQSYYTRADQTLAPVMEGSSLNIPPYQPRR